MCTFALTIALIQAITSHAFVVNAPPGLHQRQQAPSGPKHNNLSTQQFPSNLSSLPSQNEYDEHDTPSPSLLTRRTTLLLPFLAAPLIANAAEDGSSPDAATTSIEESITERAARLSREATPRTLAKASTSTDIRTAYDFSLPVAGEEFNVATLIGQEFLDEGADAKVKAILVVNIKQDDPIARKNIPELIALTQRYGKAGLAVICIPTDQGYYEPDTSAMIRLKLTAEYGYGKNNPYTVLTDKVNLLGTGANPFMRWLQGECRTPQGIGRIQANFEKFLLDGRTGRPIRRYPRKYEPVLLNADIEATLAKKPLPPPLGNYQEEWRSAAVDVERDLYRFQKGLNYFDQ